MAEGGPGRGRGGRGALIAKLLEMDKRPGQTPAAATGEKPPPITPPVEEPAALPLSRPQPVIGGRGAFYQRLQQQNIEVEKAPPIPEAIHQPPVPSSVELEAPKPSVPMGRGRLLQMMMQKSQAAASPVEQSVAESTAPTPTPAVEASVKSVTRQMRRMEVVPGREPVIMRGTDGKEEPASANYIPLFLQPGRGVFEYEVRFSPLVDDRALCYKLLFDQHRDVIGRHRTFDGVTLYVPLRLPEEAMNLTSIHPITNELHSIKLIFRRQKPIEECTHMFNVLFNTIQRELNLVRVGREHYSANMAHIIPQYKLEVWPGYVTAVDCFEGGIMLNCNASHKVLRTETVLHMIDDIIHGNRSNWKDILVKTLVGQSVMTRQPVNIYRVDDINFSSNPASEFEKQDGTKMTYVEYYKRKGVTLKDLQQPLLIHKPKPSKRQILVVDDEEIEEAVPENFTISCDETVSAAKTLRRWYKDRE